MRLITLTSLAFVLALSAPSGLSETVVLRQGFDDFEVGVIGAVGAENVEGGIWREFGKGESSPKVSTQEFFSATGAGSGKSVAIIRDNASVHTTDFWLIARWESALDSGIVRISFSAFRDSEQSGFSVHLGTAEKNLGENTIAVTVPNKSSFGTKLAVMDKAGAWKATPLEIPVGTWTRILMEIDFSAKTYRVSANGEFFGEAIPFEANGPLRQIAFIPTYPDGNLSCVDEVEVVALD